MESVRPCTDVVYGYDLPTCKKAYTLWIEVLPSSPNVAKAAECFQKCGVIEDCFKTCVASGKSTIVKPNDLPR